MQAYSSIKSKKIVILGTGGTIAGRAGSASDNLGYTAAQLGVEQLVEAIPELAAANNLIIEQVAQIDSKDMSFAVWTKLALRVHHYLTRDDVQGIVITHGTDTLEETAYFLQSLLNPAKAVVLTCSMRPASSMAPDGPQNVLDAVAVASQPGARGVIAVCAGTIHSAREVQKVHTYQLDAFSSGDAGPIGYVEEGFVRLLRKWPFDKYGCAQAAIKKIAVLTSVAAWPHVEIVMNYAGASGALVDALVAQGVRGIVVAATGNGTLHLVLEASLHKAQAADVKIVLATRCLNGRVLPRTGAVIPDSKGLSPVKARVDLILSLLC